MAVAWGNFEDMAVYYLRELAKRGEETPMMICKTLEPVYGVCSYVEYAGLIEMSGPGMLRPVSAASPDEFMGLLFARYLDFAKEDENADDKEDLPTGQQSGDKHTDVDA
ncbi:hypothetical protein ES703_88336 [subsurface metagenome]